MSGKLLNFFYLYFVLFLLTNNVQSMKNTNSCPCDPTVIPSSVSGYVPSDEIIAGVNYGKVRNVGNRILLGTVFPLTTYSYLFMENKCPPGYALPKKEDIDYLILQPSFKTTLNALGIADAKVVLSSTKASTSVDPSIITSYTFFGVTVEATMKNISQNTVYVKSKSFTICIAQSNLSFSGSSLYDYQTGGTYSQSVTNSFIQNAIWQMDGITAVGKTVNLPFNYNGSHNIKLTALDIAGNISCTCGSVYSVDYSYTSQSKLVYTGLTNSQIILNNLALKSSNMNYTYFNRGNAQIAPIENGGFYLFYSTDAFVGTVLVFDDNMKVLKTIVVGKNKLVCDILAVNGGFVIYSKMYDNNDWSFIEMWTDAGEMKWTKNLMSNRTASLDRNTPPSIVVDQITFYNSSAQPLNGNQLMFANQSGKLSFGRGLISLIFTHYNHFGLYSNGTRSDHTGDSLYTFDLNGEVQTYAWTWNASHSIQITNYYDGRHYVTAVTGEPFPESFRVCFTYPDELNPASFDGVRQKNVNIKYKCFDDLIPGKVPGDGKGKACGFLGGVTQVGDTYALIYSRKACELPSHTGTGITSDYTGEIGITFFKYDTVNQVYTDKRNFNLGDGTNVKGIRSVNLGNKIFILVSKTDKPTSNLIFPSFVTDKSDRTEYMLVDLDGNKTVPDTRFDTELIVPVSDDLRTLKNGTTVWSYVDKVTFDLKIAYIKPPSQGFLAN